MSINTKRTLLIVGAIIILCICITAAVTYALFSDQKSITNHLKAGDLNISLTRTNLVYEVLDTDGYMKKTEITQDVDFTSPTKDTVFGINTYDAIIAPESYFDAEFLIENKGNVAFTYGVTITLSSAASKLAEQLEVTITHPSGSTTTKMLSELANGLTITAGEMSATSQNEKFSVKIAFADDVDYNADIDNEDEYINNNVAKNDSAIFDLVVVATQKTDR